MSTIEIFGLIAVVVLAFGGTLLLLPESHAEDKNPLLKNFSDCDELKAYLEANKPSDREYWYYGDMVMEAAVDAAPASGEQKGSRSDVDYSGTNIQVEGVDEADIVKTDGRYLYVVSGDDIYILDAYPAEKAKVLSEIETDIYPTEIFVNDDKLVVFGSENYQEAAIEIYDISDREDPELEESIDADGRYVDSRMIGDYVYLIVSEPVYYWEDDIEIPAVKVGEEVEGCGCSEVYYFDDPVDSYSFTTVVAIDLDDNDVSSKVFLTGSAEDMYVSKDSIYVVHRSYGQPPIWPLEERELPVDPSFRSPEEKTVVHKLSIDDGDVDYEGKGEVPGHVLNQFSMDEYEGHFRIATTVGNVARFAGEASSKNNVYVLDEDLEIVGSVEDLAPGEKIYSARFMGERCYLVTFRKVDPLFVVDLSDPEEPEVLGKLKIPGYSDYLHPYDENHLIGLGKEAIPAEDGDFSWYQGVKLSLFDVSDVENPKEVAKYEIGDRGTESYALHDHKAFLFSRSKNLLVIPILLAEVDEDRYAGEVEPFTHGDYTFQGAYVFRISPESGFRLRGTVSHMEDEELLKSGHYFQSENSVKRSLYIEDVLYIVSDSMVKMNDLGDLSEIKEVALD